MLWRTSVPSGLVICQGAATTRYVSMIGHTLHGDRRIDQHGSGPLDLCRAMTGLRALPCAQAPSRGEACVASFDRQRRSDAAMAAKTSRPARAVVSIC